MTGKVKNHENIDDIIEVRSIELRNISADAVEDILRDDSPLAGISCLRFDYNKSKELYESIINYHILEIDSEIEDINNYLIKLFGRWVTKIYKYNHDQNK